jgi:hypothetical protein
MGILAILSYMKNTIPVISLLLTLLSVHAQPPQRYDIVINEIMTNPSPSPGLPEVKYIELYNISAHACLLKGWTISDGKSTATIKEDILLEPDSIVIIGSSGAMTALSSFGRTVAVTNFPTLRVNGDVIMLHSAEHMLIHAVQYDRSWYGNEVKAAGGWSLEMIDAKNPCVGADNWSASTGSRGGTPGTKNAVAATNTDQRPPELRSAFSPDERHITLSFSEPLDSTGASDADNYTVNEGIGTPVAATAEAPLFNKVTLTLGWQQQMDKVYTVSVKNITDCSGNRTEQSSAWTALAALPQKNDIVINEVLFNAPDDGAEYIELYNRSSHTVNSKDLLIATRNSSGGLGTMKPLTSENLLLFPGEYKALSADTAAVKRHYTSAGHSGYIEVEGMPALANAGGAIVLLNLQGETIDELTYNESWHLPLISNKKGVALERINADAATQDQHNWQSAAASAGYGTPGYQNSQYRADLQVQGDIAPDPDVFSPDNDGHDDYLLIRYRFPETGNVCNITIYDAAGRAVRHLVRNGICGTQGFYKWDGLDENSQPLRIGIYVVLAEVFNLQGKTKQFKKAVVLAKRLNGR